MKLTRRFKTRGPGLALMVIFALSSGTALAQATWIVQTLIPQVISIRTPTTTIGFEISNKSFPPARFPHDYSANLPEGGLPVQIYVNGQGAWAIQLQIPDITTADSLKLIPASRVKYRVNGGAWLHADGTPQVIYSGNGPTGDWREIRLELAMTLNGDELAGAYQVNAVLTALRQP